MTALLEVVAIIVCLWPLIVYYFAETWTEDLSIFCSLFLLTNFFAPSLFVYKKRIYGYIYVDQLVRMTFRLFHLILEEVWLKSNLVCQFICVTYLVRDILRGSWAFSVGILVFPAFWYWGSLGFLVKIHFCFMFVLIDSCKPGYFLQCSQSVLGFTKEAEL